MCLSSRKPNANEKGNKVLLCNNTLIFYISQIKYLESWSCVIHALDIPLKSNFEHVIRVPLK